MTKDERKGKVAPHSTFNIFDFDGSGMCVIGLEASLSYRNGNYSVVLFNITLIAGKVLVSLSDKVKKALLNSKNCSLFSELGFFALIKGIGHTLEIWGGGGGGPMFH